jgi:hypothetical protein
MPFRTPKDRLALAFWALIVGLFVSTAVFAWQAVESQEVKGSLKGGFSALPVELDAGAGEEQGIATEYVNEGDQEVTLEGAELILPSENLELVDILARPPAGSEPVELEGVDVAPGEAVGIVVLVRVTEEGGPAGFEGLRLHYHAGGRAGQTVDRAG